MNSHSLHIIAVIIGSFLLGSCALHAQDDIYYNKSQKRTATKKINRASSVRDIEARIKQNMTELEEALEKKEETDITAKSSVSESQNNPIKTLPNKKVIENESKISSYDSLVNIKEDCKDFDYLTGQTLFLVDDSHSGNFYAYPNKNRYDNPIYKNEMIGKYFNVIEVQKRENFGMFYNDQIILKDNNDGKIYSYRMNSFNEEQDWIVVGYYEKMRKLYIGKEYIFTVPYVSKIDSQTLFDFETHEREEKIELKTKWVCVDVIVSQDKYEYHRGNRLMVVLENEKYGKKYCFLKTGNSETMLSIEKNYDSRLKDYYLADKFLPIEIYNQDLAEKNIAKKKAAESQAKSKEDRLKRMIAKHGTKYGTIIADRKVNIGMSQSMCTDAWGKPRKINRTTNSNGTHEQWVYDGGYLYFDNGILTSIQN